MADVHFVELQHGLELTRAWAGQWETLLVEEYTALLPTYRDRIRDHWEELFEQTPEFFPLATSCEVVIIPTLLRYWVFARPADSDQVRIDPHWEDDELDTWSSFRAPAESVAKQVVQQCLGGDEAWVEVEFGRLRGNTIYVDYPRRFHDVDPGHELADKHAREAEFADVVQELVGARIDRAKLAKARVDFEVTAKIPNPQRRGKAFESVLAAVLEAHGCSVELGRTFNGEQIDIFMTKPHAAVVEVRWTKKPQEREAIDILLAETRRRPPVVSGLFVSMGGFSENAIRTAREAADRAIFLMGAGDVENLINGSTHFEELWQNKVERMLRRY